MKKILYLLLAVSALGACVDDYTDANPKPKLDAPSVRVSSTGASQVVVAVPTNQWQRTFEAYANYATPVTYTVQVVDAPGKIGEIDVTSSVPDFGSIDIDESSVAAIQGQESGSFNFTFTPNPALTPDEDRSLNITISVSDLQADADGEGAKTTVITLPLSLVEGTCFSTMTAGTYRLIQASGNLDGGETFNLDTLKKYYGTANVLVEIEEERPGLYTINEITGGLWPLFYPTRANPEVSVNLCGTTINENNLVVGGLRRFVVNGTVNSDNTISITWSYARVDNATPANPAKGTYVLEPF